MMATANEDKLFAVILKGSIGLLVLLVAGSFLFLTKKTALGLLAGGTISIANFVWMRFTLQRILGSMPANAGRHAFIRYIGRLTVTGFALYFVLTSEHFALTGVLVGLSFIVINIFILSLYRVIGTGG